MVWVDIAIIALLAIYAIGGIIRGFSQEAYSVVVWAIGFMVAWFFCQDFAVLLLKVFHTLSTRLAFSFIALVCLTLVVGSVIKWLLKGSVKKTGSTLLDWLGGLLAGAVHGWVIVLILVVVAGLTPLPKDRWWQQSKYLPPFQSIAILIKGTISTRLASSINYR
jgi:membrane protein required for colicin V production